MTAVLVSDVVAIARAMPKSSTFTRSSASTITLPGLMSRWMMPARCARPPARLPPARRFRPPRRPAAGGVVAGAARGSLPGRALHHDEASVAVAPAVVHGDDVGVVQRGRRPCLALEPGNEHRVLGAFGGQHLDRDGTAEDAIGGSVDDAHPAPARARRAARSVRRASPAPASWSHSSRPERKWVPTRLASRPVDAASTVHKVDRCSTSSPLAAGPCADGGSAGPLDGGAGRRCARCAFPPGRDRRQPTRRHGHGRRRASAEGARDDQRDPGRQGPAGSRAGSGLPAAGAVQGSQLRPGPCAVARRAHAVRLPWLPRGRGRVRRRVTSPAVAPPGQRLTGRSSGALARRPAPVRLGADRQRGAGDRHRHAFVRRQFPDRRLGTRPRVHPRRQVDRQRQPRESSSCRAARRQATG